MRLHMSSHEHARVHPRLSECRLLLSLVVAALLTACSGGDKVVGPDGSSGGGPLRLSSADSQFVAGMMSAAASDAQRQLRFITAPSLPGLGSAQPPCTPTVTGGADSNGNGIPDDRTQQYTAASCTFTSNGATGTVAGSIRLQDAGGVYGYRLTYSNYTVSATKGDSLVRTIVNGSFEYRYLTATSASTLDNTVVAIETRSSRGSAILTRTANLTGQFTTTGTLASNRTFPGGTLQLNGSLGVSLAVSGDQAVSGQPTTFTLDIAVATVTAMNSPSGCSSDPAFDAGALTGQVSNGATGAVRVQFTRCGSGTSTTPPVTKR